eukprot:GILI01008400.1.p1 GENE.GILI01008400.1~~GILI01008400.1.p1  ORF type:complete len:1265 (-),score=217.40 GILI01008400.1:1-3795(-)
MSKITSSLAYSLIAFALAFVTGLIPQPGAEGAIQDLTRNYSGLTSPFANGTMNLCFMLYGTVADQGYTDATNSGMNYAMAALRSKYNGQGSRPNINFVYNANYNSVSVGANESKQREQLSNVILSNDCDYLFVSFYEFAPVSILKEWALLRPHMQIVLGSVGGFEEGLPRNLVTAEPLCDREWYLAGIVAGGMETSCVGLISAFSTVTMYYPHAFAKGIARGKTVNTSPAAEFSQFNTVPVGAWVMPYRDIAATELLATGLGCNVIATYTNRASATETAVGIPRTYAIGWEYNRQSQFGNRVLISVVRTFDDEIFTTVEMTIFNITQSQKQYYTCEVSPLSSLVSSATSSLFQAAQDDFNATRDIWSDDLFDQAGTLRFKGPITDPTILLNLDFATSATNLSNTFYSKEDCLAGTALHQSIDTAAKAKLSSTCDVCPRNSFSAAAADHCIVCPGGQESHAGASECTNKFWTPALVAAVVLACIGGVALFLGVAFAIWCCKNKKERREKRANANQHRVVEEGDPLSSPKPAEISVNEPFGMLIPISNRSYAHHSPLDLPDLKSISQQQHSVVSATALRKAEENVAEDIAEKQSRIALIESDNFYVGATLSNALGAQVMKVVLANGTTIAMKERFGTSEADGREHELITKLPPHPGIVDYYAVKYLPDTGATRVFMEYVSAQSLKDIVDEVDRPLADMTGRAFAKQILVALNFLHAHNVAHRNLLNDHILVDARGRVKIADLMTAKEVTKGSEDSLTIVAAPQNLPPEVLTFKNMLTDEFEQATKGDIWSFGLSCVEVQNRNKGPWPIEAVNNAGILRFLQSDDPVVLPCHISQTAADFMLKCLDRNPATRWSAAQLLLHPWMVEDSVTQTQTLSNKDILSAVKPVPTSRFTIDHVIGSGAFGMVYAAKLVHPLSSDSSLTRSSDISVNKTESLMAADAPIAVKAISYNTKDTGETTKLRKVMKEIAVMQSLDHANIVSYLFLEQTEISPTGHQTVYIAMEYVPGGTLKQYIVECGASKPKDAVLHGLSEQEASYFTKEMLLGLEYLHKKGFTHRDIKPSNCLLTSSASPLSISVPESDRTHLKLADFGTAFRSHGTETVSMNMQGTLMYMPPEIIREERPTTSADIWSLGASVMEMVTGNSPWAHVVSGTSFGLISFIASSEPLVMPDGLSDKCADFLLKCLQRDPLKRPTATELLSHAWLRGEGSADRSFSSSHDATPHNVASLPGLQRVDAEGKSSISGINNNNNSIAGGVTDSADQKSNIQR